MENLPAAIMVVDDIPSVCELMTELLQDYRVLSLEGTNAALEWFQQNPDTPIDLVISDFDMPPGPNGLTLLSFVQSVCPSTKRVIMSGTVADDLEQMAIDNQLDGFLLKPFTITQLHSVVSGLLPPNRRPKGPKETTFIPRCQLPSGE
ncbi:MAG: response regulator [Verrucomicrobiae bacterium]|nr:response regulator [Verrucomicrobiae bacterium]